MAETNSNGNSRRTAEYKLRSNRVHSRLRGMALEWLRKNRPEVLEALRRKAKRLEVDMRLS